MRSKQMDTKHNNTAEVTFFYKFHKRLVQFIKTNHTNSILVGAWQYWQDCVRWLLLFLALKMNNNNQEQPIIGTKTTTAMEEPPTEGSVSGQPSPGPLEWPSEHPKVPSFDSDFGKMLEDFRNKSRTRHPEQWDWRERERGLWTDE